VTVQVCEDCACSCTVLGVVIGILVVIIIALLVYILWLHKKGKQYSKYSENVFKTVTSRLLYLLRTPVSEEQAGAGRRGSTDLHHIYVAQRS